MKFKLWQKHYYTGEEAVSNFCTELNSALVHIVESKASCSKFSTLENKGYGESFRNIDVQD